MSKYTTELRYICEQLVGLQHSIGLENTDSIIEQARVILFNFDYNLENLTDRKRLETKILRHYYFREISAETVGQFRFFLKSKMIEVMEYYGELYKTARLTFNPLEDTNYTEKYTSTGIKNSMGNTETGEHTTNNGTEHSTTTDSGTSTDTTTGTSEKTTDTWETINRKGSNQHTEKGTSNSTENGTTDTTANGTVNKETSGNSTVTFGKSTKTVSDNNGTTDNSGTNTGTRSTKDRYSDTPQGTLARIENDTYLTNARITDVTDDFRHTDKTTTIGNETSTATDSGSDKTVTSGSDNTTTKDTTKTTSEKTVSGTNNVEYSGSDSEETARHAISTENGKTTSKSSGETSGNTEFSKTSGNESDLKRVVNNASQDTNTDNYFKTVKGKMAGASYAEMLTAYRNTILNLDLQVIQELSELFIFLY